MAEAVDQQAEAALIELVRRIARAEGLSRFRRLAPGETSAKSAPDDLVTAADLAVERGLARGVAGILPDARVIGEEAASADPEALAGLAEAPLCVVIDPIDGTWNFAHGLATFGTILAVVERGETVWGLLYDPVLDDWVVARRGGGAWFCREGAAPHRLSFADQASPAAVTFLPLQTMAAASLPAAAGPVAALRCSCHEYRTLLTGGATAIINANALPWDHAAGALAVVEAGGIARMRDGRPYAPGLAPPGAPFAVARSAEALSALLRDHGALLG